jgi:hypothetical protein
VLSDPVAVALSVAQIFEACGLRYLVGGSLASSMSGEPRSTLDVDVVVAMTESDIGKVTNGLRVVSGVTCWVSCSCRAMRSIGHISESAPNASASLTFW